MDNIEVLVCDDSALMRNLISRIVDETEGMNVCGTAMNGKFALQKIPFLKPDLILLDIEMPETRHGYSCCNSFFYSNKARGCYNAVP